MARRRVRLSDDALEWRKSMIKMKRVPFRRIHSIHLGQQSKGKGKHPRCLSFLLVYRQKAKTKRVEASCTSVLQLSTWMHALRGLVPDGVAPSFTEVVNWCDYANLAMRSVGISQRSGRRRKSLVRMMFKPFESNSRRLSVGEKQLTPEPKTPPRALRRCSQSDPQHSLSEAKRSVAEHKSRLYLFTRSDSGTISTFNPLDRKLVRHASNPNIFAKSSADEAKKLEERLHALSEKGAIDASDYSKILRMIRTGKERVFRMCALLLSSIESARGIRMYAEENESPKCKRESLEAAPKAIYDGQSVKYANMAFWVKKLTSETSNRQAFLATMPLFAHPLDVARRLVSLFGRLRLVSRGSREVNLLNAVKLTITQARILSMLKDWIMDFSDDFRNSDTGRFILDFLKKLTERFDAVGASHVKGLISELIGKLSSISSTTPPKPRYQRSKSGSGRTLVRRYNGNEAIELFLAAVCRGDDADSFLSTCASSSVGKKLAAEKRLAERAASILFNHPKSIAEQLTLMEDAFLFSRLHRSPRDILFKAAGTPAKCPITTQLVDLFNLRTRWVRTEIIRETEKQRTKAIEFFIDVAAELAELASYNVLESVVRGLDVVNVKVLTSSYHDKLRSLQEIVSPSGNYATYRSLESERRARAQAMLPMLTVVLRDLHAYQECMSSAHPDDPTMLHWTKYRRMYDCATGANRCGGYYAANLLIHDDTLQFVLCERMARAEEIFQFAP